MNVFESTQTESAAFRDQPARVTPESVRTYLADLTDRGRSADTVRMYASRLRTLWEDLPPDKQVRRETLADWQDTLLDRGYSPGTVNTHLSAANGLLEHMGRRDLQLVGQLDVVPEVQPELTRTEYLRLLQTARTLGRERIYLMVKVFALTGIRVGELSLMTAEAVEAGRLPAEGEAFIPGCLRRELLDYMARRGIRTGPVFVSRNGRALRRTQVTAEIQALSRDAQVEEAKCNPRCLRRLYRSTRTDVEQSVRLLAEQAYERMLDTEQLAVGWDENEPFPTGNYESAKKEGDCE